MTHDPILEKMKAEIQAEYDAKRCVVRDMKHFMELAEGEGGDFLIYLAGGLCYSRKTIRLNEVGIFEVYHHIDDSEEEMDREALLKWGMIEQALKAKMLVYEPF